MPGRRELLTSAVPPAIISVTPQNGTTSTVTTPPIKVTFNEDVIGANIASNFTLFDAQGNSIPISAATYSNNGGVYATTLTYNSGSPLPAGTYTLFVYGNNITGTVGGIPLAQPGQLVVANSGSNDVGTISMPGNGLLNAGSQYALAGVPTAMTMAPLIFGGLSDLLVVDSTTNTVDIYAGRATGGFDPKPDSILNLPSGAGATAIAVGTIYGENDVVVADTAINMVSYFQNGSTAGYISFFAARNYAVGESPDGVVISDITGAGTADICVANGNTNVKLGNDTVDDYFVTVIPPTPKTYPATPFGPALNFKVGDVTPTGLTSPTGIAAGDFDDNGLNDLVVSGGGGLAILTNATAGTTVKLNLSMITAASTSSVTTGYVQTIIPVAPDIVATSPAATLGTNGELLVFLNNGTGTFSALQPIATGVSPVGVQIANFSGSFNNDIVVANDTDPGSVTIFQNLSTQGTIINVTGSNPITVTSATPTGLADGDQVYVSGVLGTTNANGAFIVGSVTSTTFTLTGAVNNGTYTAGTGTWQGIYLENGTGTVTGATNVAGQPITITSRNNALFNGQLVTVTGVLGNTGANGTFVVANVTANTFQLVGSTGTGTYTKGGTWALAPYSVGADPVGVAVADTNGDGVPDIVTANSYASLASLTGNLTVLLGNANGGFTTSTEYPLAPAYGASSVAVGDVNGDGLPDVVVADPVYDQVSIFLALGDGGFAPPEQVSTLFNGAGQDPVSVTLASLNGPGTPLDIIAACQGDSTVSILNNNGSGVFTAVGTESVGAGPTQVVAADFNGDGLPDLAVSHSTGSTGGVTILINAGNETFQPGYEIATGIPAQALAVGDFNNDGNQDLVVADDAPVGAVVLELGDGTGNFVESGSYPVIGNPSALAVADLTNNGYPDVIAVTNSPLTTEDGSVLLNALGGGFDNAVNFSVDGGIGLESATTARVYQGTYPDLIVTASDTTATDNIYTMEGVGNGTFFNTLPYIAGTSPEPSAIAVVSDPYFPVTTFNVVSTTVNANLVSNGDFQTADLSGEPSDLDGWQTYDEPGTPGSNGRWSTQTGTTSPLSETAVPAPPVGNYEAMLDEPNQLTYVVGESLVDNTPTYLGLNTNPNTIASYSGSHALYQDIAIPASTTQLTVSFDLYIDSAAAFSNTSVTPQLEFNTTAANQQVRVDLVNPNALPLTTTPNNPGTNTPGVLQNLFVTDPSQAFVETIPVTITLNAASFAGQTVVLRFGETNNQGMLIVGVDDVKLQAVYKDTQAPSLSSLQIRNPSSVASATVPDPTTDPTIIGKVADSGSINNVRYVEFDISTASSPMLGVFKTTTFDAEGDFSFTVPSSLLLPGLTSVNVLAMNQAGNHVTQNVSFTEQGPSTTDWAAQGPGPINVSTQGVNYQSVSGDITAIAVDPRDPTGNTYFVGAANGGVWETTDGGNDWTNLTDNVESVTGQQLPVAVGGLALGVTTNPAPGQPSAILYAATGLSDETLPSDPGIGVLKSINNGATWTLVGQSVLTGARVSSVVVSPTNPNTVYVGVTSFANSTQGPALYRSTDGGATWVNVLNPANMYLPGLTTTLGAGASLASVTSIVADPFTANRLIIGLGNIGQAPLSASAGVWLSDNGGTTWQQIVGGANPNIPNDTIPTGTSVGRVTIAIGTAAVSYEKYVYVMMGTPPLANPAVNVFDAGVLLGIYKSLDNMLDWTKIMLKQNIYTTIANPVDNDFVNINVLGHDASDVGALAVDPSDPNVVYVGGSSDYTQFATENTARTEPPNHGMIRIDTGDMRGTTYTLPDMPVQTYPNDGDDIVKAYIAAHAPPVPNPAPAMVSYRTDGFYDPVFQNGAYLPAVAYTGEGVSWYDLDDGISSGGNSFFDPPGAGISGDEQPEPDLPSSIHVLVFDNQGRLLFGTAEGIYRGTVLGFGYDLTSGGSGIVTDSGGVSGLIPSETANGSQGMSIVSINGNLQIAELSGAAIDPDNSSRMYTSEFETGTALTTSGPAGWQSSGLYGPASSTYLVQGTPNATALAVGLSVSGANVSTLSDVYRVWQAGSSNGNFPEVSADGGNTFAPVALSGIPQSEPTGFQPGFAIDPVPTVVNGVPHSLLLFGADKVFLTDSSTNVWDAISPVLSPGAYVTRIGLRSFGRWSLLRGHDQWRDLRGDSWRQLAEYVHGAAWHSRQSDRASDQQHRCRPHE